MITQLQEMLVFGQTAACKPDWPAETTAGVGAGARLSGQRMGVEAEL